MKTEIEQIEDKIIEAITDQVPEFRIVDTWPDQSDLEDLMKSTLALPACYVIYGGTRHGEKKVIGASTGDKDQTYRITIILQNLRKPMQEGQRGAYQLIEALVGNTGDAGLIKRISLAPIPGFFWPIEDGLIEVKFGKFAYGIELVRKTIR